jgi:glycosyltransferase involved in cell wall biosynthesis
MLAPISHPIPPPSYGPWERVCFELVEGLQEMGHEVTLFAAAGTKTSASHLVETSPQPLDEGDLEPRLWEERHIAMAMHHVRDAGFDVVHSHLHVHALGFAPFLRCPLVSTLHGVAWHEPHRPLLLAYKDQPFVSISDAERSLLPELNYVATVYNGIRTEDFVLNAGPGGYLAFVGRIAPEKAVDLAIEVAKRSGMSLRLAGGVEEKHAGYFEETIEPALGGAVEYLGTLDRQSTIDLLANAAALLMPLRWDEPFGLVVTEAMACGTPVVAWRRGAMPEIIDDGVTGFLVDDVEGAVAAVDRLGQIDPGACRRRVEQLFSREAMAQGYEGAYRQAIEQRN